MIIQSAKINTRFPELHAKAKAGDVAAAVELVSKVVKPEKVKALAERYPNAIVAFVHAVESTGRNQLPAAYADVFESYGLKQSDVVQINKPGHTGADRVGRFIRRARFDGDVEQGKEYIIIDDMFTMGGTLRDLKDYIESQGGEVVAVSTLAASRYGTALRPTEEQIKQINEIGITNEQLKELGIADNIEGLTRQEAAELIVLANAGGNQGTPRGRSQVVRNLPRTETETQSEVDSPHFSISPEEQERQTRTGNFKRWFGDWERDSVNASKVVDENGRPIIMSHNTDNEFYTFDRDRIGSGQGQAFLGMGPEPFGGWVE